MSISDGARTVASGVFVPTSAESLAVRRALSRMASGEVTSVAALGLYADVCEACRYHDEKTGRRVLGLFAHYLDKLPPGRDRAWMLEMLPHQAQYLTGMGA